MQCNMQISLVVEIQLRNPNIIRLFVNLIHIIVGTRIPLETWICPFLEQSGLIKWSC